MIKFLKKILKKIIDLLEKIRDRFFLTIFNFGKTREEMSYEDDE